MACIKEASWVCANGVKCGEVEWVKRNALRWFGQSERKKSEEFVKKMYVFETPWRSPVVRRKEVKEYMNANSVNRKERVFG